ncbi:MAG: DUF502 domain-containing protein [Verrucomicrobiota bacterium]
MPDEPTEPEEQPDEIARWIEDKKKKRGGYLLAGILALTPITVTGFVIYFLFDILAQVGATPALWMADRVAPYVPELANFLKNEWFLRTMAVVLVIAMIYIIGWLAKNVLGSQLISLMEKILERIPFVKTVYGAVKKLVLVLQENPAGDVKRVVLIEFPSPYMKTVGLVTRTFKDDLTGQELAAVYVPTTPNPTSGYLEIVPIENVVSTDWGLEEAMTFIVSGGAIAPENIIYSKPPPTEEAKEANGG